MRKIDPKVNRKLESAIVYLVNSSPNAEGKPVILHSIRVGLYLDERGYNKNLVIAAILHDLLEDSVVSYQEIENKFGKDVAKLVRANSFDKDMPEKTIQDKRKRYNQSLERCLNAGKRALIIKAADILDNSYYYHLAPNKKMYSWLLEKMEHFISQATPFIKNEIVWKDLSKQYHAISKDRL